jgi:hypothetical protein
MFAYCLTVTGVSEEQANQMEQEIQRDQLPGLLLHAGGAIPGGYRYVELWDSRDEAMRFHDAHVRRALRDSGLDLDALDVQIAEIERVTTLVAGHDVTVPALAKVG